MSIKVRVLNILIRIKRNAISFSKWLDSAPTCWGINVFFWLGVCFVPLSIIELKFAWFVNIFNNYSELMEWFVVYLNVGTCPIMEWYNCKKTKCNWFLLWKSNHQSFRLQFFRPHSFLCVFILSLHFYLSSGASSK